MSITHGPAFVSGVNHTLHAIRTAMRSGVRADAAVFHPYTPGSDEELSYSEGSHFASVKALAGAEFAFQVRSKPETNNN